MNYVTDVEQARSLVQSEVTLGVIDAVVIDAVALALDFQEIIAGAVGQENTYGTCVGRTFGGAGVVRIPRLQELLRYICEQGFEHLVAANLAPVASAVREPATRYLGWSVHHHN